MKLSEARKQFIEGHLKKQDFILKCHEINKQIFDYTNLLSDGPIDKIEISSLGVIFHTRDAVRFIIDPKDKRAAPIEALNFGSYESDQELMIRKLLKPGNIFLDVGANIGWYSIRFAAQIKGLKVYAFEPAKSTYSYLVRNVDMNSVTSVIAVNKALSDTQGTKKLFFSQEMAVNASLANVNPISSTVEEDCIVTTIDQFIEAQKIKRVDFIKCDIEGAELFALKGAKETIANHRPIIFCEMLRKWSAVFGYHPNELILFLKGYGYDCFTVDNSVLSPFTSMNDLTVQTNFFFLPRELKGI